MVGLNLKRGLRPAIAVIALAAASLPVTAAAQSGDLVARWDQGSQRDSALGTVLSPEERTLYRQLFAMIDAEQWGEVESLLAARPDGVLTQIARAEYYTHANSPKVSP